MGGMNLSGVNPDHIRIFGNGGGMLPEKNSDARRDDLQEIAIAIYDGNDGNFDEGDYILFYAEGPPTNGVMFLFTSPLNLIDISILTTIIIS